MFLLLLDMGGRPRPSYIPSIPKEIETSLVHARDQDYITTPGMDRKAFPGSLAALPKTGRTVGNEWTRGDSGGLKSHLDRRHDSSLGTPIQSNLPDRLHPRGSPRTFPHLRTCTRTCQTHDLGVLCPCGPDQATNRVGNTTSESIPTCSYMTCWDHGNALNQSFMADGQCSVTGNAWMPV